MIRYDRVYLLVCLFLTWFVLGCMFSTAALCTQGVESLVPLMDELLRCNAAQGVNGEYCFDLIGRIEHVWRVLFCARGKVALTCLCTDVVVGMAHRGRLNLMTVLLQVYMHALYYISSCNMRLHHMHV